MCRPYGFGRHADMTETPLRSITNSGIWIPMLAPTRSTMISSDEPRCRGFNQSVCNSLCQSVCYLPEIRSSVSNTLFNLVTDKSLYSFRNTSSRDQLLGHIVHIMMMSYRVGPKIPLHLHGVTNPSLDSCQPNRHFQRYP